MPLTLSVGDSDDDAGQEPQQTRLRHTIGALMRMVVFDVPLSARACSESGMIVETDPTPAVSIESSPGTTAESTDRLRHVIAFRDDGFAGYQV